MGSIGNPRPPTNQNPSGIKKYMKIKILTAVPVNFDIFVIFIFIFDLFVVFFIRTHQGANGFSHYQWEKRSQVK